MRRIKAVKTYLPFLIPVVILVYLFVSITLEPHNWTKKNQQAPEVIEEWYVHIDGTQYGSITIPSMFSYGKNTSLFYTLETIRDNTYISFCTLNHRVRVSVAKKPIYEFGFSDGKYTSIPPISCEHIIEMKPSYSGEVIQIDLYPTVFPAGKMTRPITIGTLEQIQLYSYMSYRATDLIGYIIFLSGLVIALLYLVLNLNKYSQKNLLYCSLLFMMAGCNMTTQTCLSTSVITDPYLSFYLFWVSLLFIPSLAYHILSNIFSGKITEYFRNYSIISSVFACVGLLLTIINLDLCEIILMVYYGIHFILLLSIFVYLLKAKQKLYYPCIPMFLLLTIDILNHYLQLVAVDYLSYITLCSLYTTIFTFYLTVKQTFHQLYQKQYEYQAMDLKIESLKKSYADAEAYTEQMNIFRHDMKKHLLAVQGLIENDQNEQAIKYLSDITGAASLKISEKYSDNHLINAILQNNVNRCEKSGIRFSYEVSLPEKVGIEDGDLCASFANCLDNAYEACKHVSQNPFIDIKAYLKNDYLYLRVENSKKGRLFINKGAGHGLGLKIVEDIVTRYNGIMNVFPEDEGIFVIEIALKQQH